MRRVRHLALASLCVASAASLSADQQACDPETKPGVPQIAFDAATGTTDTGKTLKMKDEIQIVVTNLNPFRYEYEFQINEEELVSDAIGDFLKILAIPGFESTEESAPAGSTGSALGGSPKSKDCGSLSGATKTVDAMVAELDLKQAPRFEGRFAAA